MYWRKLLLIAFSIGWPLSAAALPDIVFVTQPPHPADFATANATFGNHQATLDSIPRGGDLYIRYSDGTLKNITAAAGFGNSGFQGANAIAVRDPSVHWNGNKIIFSMVIGAPTQQYQYKSYRWQIYEVTNIGQSQIPVITKVPNQSADYNNVMPIYGTNERIIFVSDRPHAGLTHTYPQRDEYESTPTNTGLWSLNPATGDIFQLDHSPSGDFNPSLDSFGRVLFTRWDHLQRDQQNRCSQSSFGAFNFENELPNAQQLDTDTEVFPEPRGNCELPPNSILDRHSFNHFFPWQINEDGTEMETVNHIGRHELVSYIGKSFNNDPNIEEFYSQYTRFNQKSIENFFQIHEHPQFQGVYYGINAPEFGTHASGQIIKMDAPPSLTADKIAITYVTHHDTANPSDSPSGNHIGLSRDPMPLSDGTLIAAHAGTTRSDSNIGSSAAPQSRYSFRLRKYEFSGSYAAPTDFLTSGITKSVNYWSPDQMVTYTNATLWELQPQEIRIRAKPNAIPKDLEAPEKEMFNSAAVDLNEFKTYLRDNNLALIVSRNVTTRDELDHQQPFNLTVAGSSTSTIAKSGKAYEIGLLQIFQGDLIRAYESNGANGRRVIAQPMHSVSSNPDAHSVAGSVKIAADGSLAAFVPARRALTYQLTDNNGVGVVRERFWLTFQPGEIRVCASCHGVNGKDQKGHSAPVNPPQALKSLLEYWKGIPHDSGPGSDFELKLKLTAKKAKSGSLAPLLTYSITPGTGNGAQRTVSLKLQAGKTSCGEIASFTTGADGRYSASSKALPAVAKNTTLQFSLEYGERKIASKRYLLARNTRKKPVSTKNLCAALKKSFQ